MDVVRACILYFEKSSQPRVFLFLTIVNVFSMYGKQAKCLGLVRFESKLLHLLSFPSDERLQQENFHAQETDS